MKRQKTVDSNESKDVNKVVSLFHKLVAEGPIYVCVCCDQLWYRHSVEKGTVLSKLNNTASKKCLLVTSSVEFSGKWICKTCLLNLKTNKIPRCAKVNKMVFPQNPKDLDLTELEWRLVSPRLVFEKLHEAPRGKQMKITGNVVNVPANVVNTVIVLPRLSHEGGIIRVQLKRKLKYKSYTLSQNVRPAKVFAAAKWLTENGSLFKQERITLNKNWVYSDGVDYCQKIANYDDSSSSSDKQCQMSTELESRVDDIVNTYVCLECSKCISELSDLDHHMVSEHNAVHRDCHNSVYLYRYNILTQNEVCSGYDEVFFCSICSYCEGMEEKIREHMVIVHDIPSEEFFWENSNLIDNNLGKIFLHRIIKPSSVLLAGVFKQGYMCVNSVPLRVSVAAPSVVDVGFFSNRS